MELSILMTTKKNIGSGCIIEELIVGTVLQGRTSLRGLRDPSTAREIITGFQEVNHCLVIIRIKEKEILNHL